jgi:hypothetical protein
MYKQWGSAKQDLKIVRWKSESFDEQFPREDHRERIEIVTGKCP